MTLSDEMNDFLTRSNAATTIDQCVALKRELREKLFSLGLKRTDRALALLSVYEVIGYKDFDLEREAFYKFKRETVDVKGVLGSQE